MRGNTFVPVRAWQPQQGSRHYQIVGAQRFEFFGKVPKPDRRHSGFEMRVRGMTYDPGTLGEITYALCLLSLTKSCQAKPVAWV